MKKPMPIQDYMSRTPRTIGYDIPLDTAKAMMKEHNIRHLPVLQGGKLVGVLSDRNVKSALGFPGGEKFLVEDAMMPDVFSVGPEADLATTVEEMADEKYGCAIIEDEKGTVIGIFTTVDACRVLAGLLKGC